MNVKQLNRIVNSIMSEMELKDCAGDIYTIKHNYDGDYKAWIKANFSDDLYFDYNQDEAQYIENEVFKQVAKIYKEFC